MKIFAVLLVSIVGLQTSMWFGPMSNLPAFASVDETYFSLLYKHYLVSGLVTSIFAYACAAALRVSYTKTLALVALVGISYSFSVQLDDPDAFSYLLPAVIEFLVPYMGVSVFVAAGFYGVARLKQGQ